MQSIFLPRVVCKYLNQKYNIVSINNNFRHIDNKLKKIQLHTLLTKTKQIGNQKLDYIYI